MQKVLSAEEMREVDRLTTEKYGVPSILLMENAAHAASRAIAEKLGGSLENKSFLVLCGKGSNGGDGAALARILWTRGARVDVYLFGRVEETKDDARTNFEILKNIVLSKSQKTGKLSFEEVALTGWRADAAKFEIDKFDVLVDALFGTGLSRPLDISCERLVRICSAGNHSQKTFFVSIDVPSGLSADLAEPIGANIKADLTVTFTAPKPANILAPASNFNGELVVANIGSPRELIDDSPSKLFLAERRDARNWLEKTEFSTDSHKTKRGRAFIVAGSRNMAGAAALCANAAMLSGIGLVRVAVPRSAQAAVSSRVFPEAMVAELAETEKGAVSEAALDEVFEFYEKMNVLAVGSGLSSGEETTRKFVRELIEKRKSPAVIDADGLNSLAPFDLRGNDEFPLILTPHIGEMRKLLGAGEKEDFKDRVKIARDFAEKHHVFLILKGERNLIAAPDGRVVVNPTGNSGLGKAGNGDTLAGIIAGFVGQADALKVDVFETLVAAVYIAALAGDIAEKKFGKRAMKASDASKCLAEAFREIVEN